MTPGNKLKLRYGLVGAAVLIGVVLVMFALTGCAVGRTDDGQYVIGFQQGDAAIRAAETFGGLVGGIFGGPAGAVTGAGLAGSVATALWGLRRGERKGWDEAVGTPGKPGQAGHASSTVVVNGNGGGTSTEGQA